MQSEDIGVEDSAVVHVRVGLDVPPGIPGVDTHDVPEKRIKRRLNNKKILQIDVIYLINILIVLN